MAVIHISQLTYTGNSNGEGCARVWLNRKKRRNVAAGRRGVELQNRGDRIRVRRKNKLWVGVVPVAMNRIEIATGRREEGESIGHNVADGRLQAECDEGQHAAQESNDKNKGLRSMSNTHTL